MELHYRAGEAISTVGIRRKPEGGGGAGAGAGAYVVTVDGRPHDVVVRAARGGRLDLVVDGRPVRAHAAEDGARRLVRLEGRPPLALVREETRAPRRRRARGAGGEEGLAANMHAQVSAIPVAEGDAVERGTTLVVLEAMKMELRVVAPYPGRVRSIDCRIGEVVERGRILVELEPLDSL